MQIAAQQPPCSGRKGNASAKFEIICRRLSWSLCRYSLAGTAIERLSVSIPGQDSVRLLMRECFEVYGGAIFGVR